MRLVVLHIFCLLIVLSGFNCYAQNENNNDGDDLKITVRPSKYSMRAELSVPNVLNGAWKKSMVGVFEANLSLNYRLPRNLFVGVGYKESLFYTPPKFYVFEVKTRQRQHSPFIKIGYDSYKSNKYFVTPAVISGWMFTRYSNIVCKETVMNWDPAYQSWFIEPQVALNFLPDPNFGINFHFSFVYSDHIWDPRFVCLDEHIQYEGARMDRKTTYFNFGFGLYWGFGKGKYSAVK